MAGRFHALEKEEGKETILSRSVHVIKRRDHI